MYFGKLSIYSYHLPHSPSMRTLNAKGKLRTITAADYLPIPHCKFSILYATTLVTVLNKSGLVKKGSFS